MLGGQAMTPTLPRAERPVGQAIGGHGAAKDIVGGGKGDDVSLGDPRVDDGDGNSGLIRLQHGR